MSNDQDFTIRVVYAELIGSLKDLRAGRMTRDQVDSACKIANSVAQLINSEANMMKTIGGTLGSGFIPEARDPFEKDIPQYAIEGMRDCSFCKVESCVPSDAESVNDLAACDYCLTMPATIHFRKQLAQQKKSSNPHRLTEKHQEILDYLKENGGEAKIGYLFGDSKTQTTTNLLRLEDLRLIECITRPLSRADFPAEQRAKVTSEDLHIGVWKLTNAGMKAAA